jgi:hypothetical protein
VGRFLAVGGFHDFHPAATLGFLEPAVDDAQRGKKRAPSFRFRTSQGCSRAKTRIATRELQPHSPRNRAAGRMVDPWRECSRLVRRLAQAGHDGGRENGRAHPVSSAVQRPPDPPPPRSLDASFRIALDLGARPSFPRRSSRCQAHPRMMGCQTSQGVSRRTATSAAAAAAIPSRSYQSFFIDRPRRSESLSPSLAPKPHNPTTPRGHVGQIEPRAPRRRTGNAGWLPGPLLQGIGPDSASHLPHHDPWEEGRDPFPRNHYLSLSRPWSRPILMTPRASGTDLAPSRWSKRWILFFHSGARAYRPKIRSRIPKNSFSESCRTNREAESMLPTANRQPMFSFFARFDESQNERPWDGIERWLEVGGGRLACLKPQETTRAAATSGVTSLCVCVCVAGWRRSGIGRMTARALKLEETRSFARGEAASSRSRTGTGEGARPHRTAPPHSGYDRLTDTPPARAGWNPNNTPNVSALPTTGDVLRRRDALSGRREPSHRSSRDIRQN